MKELKKYQKNEETYMEKIIEKELTKYKNTNNSNIDYDIRNLLYGHDCATINGIKLMGVGFGYLAITVAIFPIIGIINA